MADPKLEINVDVTGLDVPLMIIVGENRQVQVYENGKRVDGVKKIIFTADVNKLPVITITRFIRGN